jgi:DNA-binding NarL/FixJ family response regulator
MSGPAAPAPIRVLLVDDHEVLRAGLANLLALQKDLAVVGEAGSGEEGISLWKSRRPDVGLIDLSMGCIDGLETVKRIRQIAPDAKLVMLTSSESTVDAARSLEAGAVAYVTKHSSPREIIEVIRQVSSGQTHLQRGVREVAASATPHLLSERELTVLQLIRQGWGNAEIGRELGVVERTVKCHVTAILAKLGAHDRAGAVARGFDLGILEIDRSR